MCLRDIVAIDSKEICKHSKLILKVPTTTDGGDLWTVIKQSYWIVTGFRMRSRNDILKLLLGRPASR